MNIKQLIIWAVLPSCVAWVISFFLPVTYTTTAYPYIISFFTVLNLLFNKYFIKLSAGKEAQTVAGILMAFIGIKFILSICAVAAFLFLNKVEQHIGFAINFFVVYMIFAVYETKALLAQTK